MPHSAQRQLLLMLSYMLSVIMLGVVILGILASDWDWDQDYQYPGPVLKTVGIA